MAFCVNCHAWHGSDSTLCDEFVALPTVAHAALAALPEGERPEWLDSDTWIAGFYAGFRAAAGLETREARS